KRRAQRPVPVLTRKGLAVLVRLRAEHGAAPPPDRRADRAVPGPPGLLLTPRFLATAPDVGAILGGVRAAATGGAVGQDGLLDQVQLQGRGEHLIRQVQFLDLLALQIDDRQLRHIPSYAFAAALAAGLAAVRAPVLGGA